MRRLRAALLYRDGLSLKAIGVRFLVAPDTIGKAIQHVGIKIVLDAIPTRPEPGTALTASE